MTPVAARRSIRQLATRTLPLALWCYAAWVLLTWTATLEVLVTGVGVAIVVAVALAPLGEVVAPWALLRPRRLWPLVVLTADCGWRILRANVHLARLIWSPGQVLTPGMVIVSTRERSDAGLAAVGILTSLIVDNQIVDVDRANHELLYHCVVVPDGDAAARYDAMNGPVEARLRAVEERR
jgi:multicomponent Na+:H+ antiporter subunit E